MKYTITDVLAKAQAMEARRAVLGDKDFKIKKRFDLRGLSHDNWVDLVYPDAKLFLKGLTVQTFKQILDDHRDLRNERDKKNTYLKRIIPDIFQFMEGGRIFFLKESCYKKYRRKIEKRKKIDAPVLFLTNGSYEIIALTNAVEIIEERKKHEKELQNNQK